VIRSAGGEPDFDALRRAVGRTDTPASSAPASAPATRQGATDDEEGQGQEAPEAGVLTRPAGAPGQTPGAPADSPLLTTQTEQELRDKAQREEAARKAEAEEQRRLAAAQAAERRRREKAEADQRAEQIRRERADAAADDFQLGQEPPRSTVTPDELAGQGDIFGDAPAAPDTFIKAPDGSIDFGEITPEMGRAMRRQAGKIRLTQGVQNPDGTGHGLAHIEARHGTEIRSAGFDSVETFVKAALDNIDRVWQPGKTAQIVAVTSGQAGRVVFLELQLDRAGGSDFYRVNSAFPANADRYTERKARREGWKPLWSRDPVPADASGASGFADQSPDAGETAPTVSDQSGAQTVAPASAPAQAASSTPSDQPASLRDRLAALQPRPADGASRAVAGGQIGINGFEYKGGQFLPSTELPPGTFRDENGNLRRGTTSEEIEPFKRETAPSPTSRSIYSLINAYTSLRDGRLGINQGAGGRGIRDAAGNAVTPETKVRPGIRGLASDVEFTLQELVDLYNAGARWIELDPQGRDQEPLWERAGPSAPADSSVGPPSPGSQSGTKTVAAASAPARADPAAASDRGLAQEEAAAYQINNPGANYDLFPDELTLQPAPAPRVAPRPTQRAGAKPAPAPAENAAPAVPVVAVRESPTLPGVYQVTSQLVQVGVRDLPVAAVRSWQNAVDALQAMGQYAVEHFDALITDKDGKPLAVVGAFKGAVAEARVYPQVLLAEALRIKGAALAWGVHNHPSGSAELSEADVALSGALANVFRDTTVRWRGVAAVGNTTNRWSAVSEAGDRMSGEIVAGRPAVARVPVVERTVRRLSSGLRVSGPSDAKGAVAALAGPDGDAGVVLLDNGGQVAGWVPMPVAQMAALTGGGGRTVTRLLNSVSMPNASRVILHLPIGAQTGAARDQRQAEQAAQNMANALDKMGVRLLDAVVSLSAPTLAETGALPVGWSGAPLYDISAKPAPAAQQNPADTAATFTEQIAHTGYPTLPVPRVQGARNLRKLVNRLAEGEITETAFVDAVRVLSNEMAVAAGLRMWNRMATERQRGPDLVREKLLAARRREEIDPDGVEFALWALGKNPALAAGLGISVRTPSAAFEGVAGDYNPATEVIRLLKGQDNEQTAVHEILHHAERMMTAPMQARIRRDWARALARAVKTATPEQREALALIGPAMAGDSAARRDLMRAFRDGPLTKDAHYHLVNPSEFWAVNAAGLLWQRFDARDSGYRRVLTWMREMLERVKSLLGLRANGNVLRALDDLLNPERNDGQARSLRLLLDVMPGDTLASIEGASPEGGLREVERAYGGRAAYDRAKGAGKTKLSYGQWLQVRTPQFKRWFGDWEAARAQGRLDAMAPVQVRIPQAWAQLSVAALRERVREALDEMVRSRAVIEHPELGEVRVGRAGERKTISEGRDPAKLMIAADLATVLPRSILASAEPDAAQNIEGYARLLARVDVGNVPLTAVLTVRTQPDGYWYYNAVALHDAAAETTTPAEAGAATAGPMRGATAEAEGGPLLTAVREFSRRPLVRVNPDTVSKAIDPDTGEPLVVYHGTGADDITVFNSPLVWASADPALASGYAEAAGDLRDGKANVMPLYAKTSAPFDADADSDKGYMRIADLVESAIRQAAQQGHPVSKADADHYRRSMQLAWNRFGLDDSLVDTHHHWSMVGRVGTLNLRDMLQSMGFDGIKYTEDSFMNGKGISATTYAVFKPEQIKSATGNSGTFDPTNSDIRFSRNASVPLARGEGAIVEATVADEVDKRIADFAHQPAVRIRQTAVGVLPGATEADKVAGAVHDDRAAFIPASADERVRNRDGRRARTVGRICLAFMHARDPRHTASRGEGRLTSTRRHRRRRTGACGRRAAIP